MQVIEPSVEVITKLDGILGQIERVARTCYQSKSCEGSTEPFVQRLVKRGHHAMLEFADVTVRIICDRGISHELVRHRLASYAQESTRYCKYDEIQVIKPVFWLECSPQYTIWLVHMRMAEANYKDLILQGASPQEARCVLPSSLKTEIVMKANIREWRHFFKLRCSKYAHPQMQEIANMILVKLKKIPVVFEDLKCSL